MLINDHYWLIYLLAICDWWIEIGIGYEIDLWCQTSVPSR